DARPSPTPQPLLHPLLGGLRATGDLSADPLQLAGRPVEEPLLHLPGSRVLVHLVGKDLRFDGDQDAALQLAEHRRAGHADLGGAGVLRRPGVRPLRLEGSQALSEADPDADLLPAGGARSGTAAVDEYPGSDAELEDRG